MNDLMKDKNFQYILAAAACVLVLYYIMSPLQQCIRHFETTDNVGYMQFCYKSTTW